MVEDTFKAAVWYSGKIVNEDGNNPRYVGGMVKFINVDPDTKLEVFRGTVRDISGIPEAVPITLKYHIFISSKISKLLDITPYESLKFMLQPDLMLHMFYVEENVVEDGTDTISNMPRCPKSARNSNAVQSPPTGVESPVKPSAHGHVDGSLNHEQNSLEAPVLTPIPTRRSSKRSATDRDDSVKTVIVGDRVKRPASTNSSQMRIYITSLCGLVKTLDVERTENVGDLKERIRKTEGTEPEDQRLIYRGMQLADGSTLAAYGIADRSIIHIVQCLRGC